MNINYNINIINFMTSYIFNVCSMNFYNAALLSTL